MMQGNSAGRLEGDTHMAISYQQIRKKNKQIFATIWSEEAKCNVHKYQVWRITEGMAQWLHKTIWQRCEENKLITSVE